MTPIHVPEDWDGNGLLNFEQFCDLTQYSPRTVYDMRRTGRGPKFFKLAGSNRLFIRIEEVRRWLRGEQGDSGHTDEDNGR